MFTDLGEVNLIS